MPRASLLAEAECPGVELPESVRDIGESIHTWSLGSIRPDVALISYTIFGKFGHATV